MTASHDDQPLARALARYYEHQGLPSDGGASLSTFTVHMGPVTFRLPNPPARRRAVFYHDTNHVITGYDNVFSRGEMIIAGYELGSGCGSYWIAWLINAGMFALGLFCCPRDLFGAFVRGRRAESIYGRRESQSELAAMSVTAIRSLVGIDRQVKAATLGDRATFVGWSTLSLALLLAPVLLLGATIGAR